MSNHSSDLNQIETRLRAVLQTYEQARTKGDFLQAILGVHTALEDAFNHHLGAAANDLNFSQKAQEVAPAFYRRFNLDGLNRQRNRYAHPKRKFTGSQIRETAVGFVDFTQSAWQTLFGRSSSPPAVLHPPLSSVPSPAWSSKPTAAPAQKPIPAAKPPPTSSVPQTPPAPKPSRSKPGPIRTRTPWSSLLLGLLLLLPLPWLVGFTTAVSQTPAAPAYLLPLAIILLFILAFIALRKLLRFIFAFGLGRSLAFVSMGLVLATLANIPFAAANSNWTEGAGTALARVLTSAQAVTVDLVSKAYAGGAAQAGLIFAPASVGRALETEQDSAGAATAPATAASSSKTPAPATPVRAQLATEKISIGAAVLVQTDGSRLMSRAEPSLAAKVVVRFENGSQLTVRDGPVEADGYTWWEVEGEAGRGWSAGDFLQAQPVGESLTN